jgi:hypothetical protein
VWFLDGGATSLEHVFIPFWIVEAAFLVVPLIAVIVVLVQFFIRCNKVRCSMREGRQIVSWCCVSYLVFGPLTVFQILLIVRSDMDYKYATVFIPLLLWESILVAGAAGLAYFI